MAARSFDALARTRRGRESGVAGDQRLGELGELRQLFRCGEDVHCVPLQGDMTAAHNTPLPDAWVYSVRQFDPVPVHREREVDKLRCGAPSSTSLRWSIRDQHQLASTLRTAAVGGRRTPSLTFIKSFSVLS